MAARAWCPARAFAALTVASFAAGTRAVGLPLDRARALDAGLPANPIGSKFNWTQDVAQGAAPHRARAWRRWRPAHTQGDRGFDPTLGFPGEGPQKPRAAASPKTETLTLVTANVTSWPTGMNAGVLSSGSEVLILQEDRVREDSLRAARAETRRHKYHGQWAAARRIGPCGPASGVWPP